MLSSFFLPQLYRIRPKGTVPQGLLLTSILLMLALLFVNVTLLTIAPDYASFGYQKYVWLFPPSLPNCRASADLSLLFLTVQRDCGGESHALC